MHERSIGRSQKGSIYHAGRTAAELFARLQLTRFIIQGSPVDSYSECQRASRLSLLFFFCPGFPCHCFFDGSAAHFIYPRSYRHFLIHLMVAPTIYLQGALPAICLLFDGPRFEFL